MDGATSDEEYPPTGLSERVRKLPGWIQLGCGEKPYNCAEKGATFAPDGEAPAAMPELSKHSSFMADILNANPGIYANRASPPHPRITIRLIDSRLGVFKVGVSQL